jgi:hypothetical protein
LFRLGVRFLAVCRLPIGVFDDILKSPLDDVIKPREDRERS